jgi:NADH-quinone oxidoreductase subunit I
MIYEKSQLLGPVQEGMVAAPHPMVAGLEERDYYQGKVAKATPEQHEWADAHSSGTAPTDGDAR